MTTSARHRLPPLDPATQNFVERMGLLWGDDGLPRIAGRIFGLLLLTPGARSLDDLAALLRVSKASVSTDARLLERLGFLERTSRPGDRRDYYRISDDLVPRSLDLRLHALRRVRSLLADAPRRHDAPEVAARLDDFERVHRYAEQAVTEVLERWKRDAASRPA